MGARVLHIVTGLQMGGAEMMLARLAGYRAAAGGACEVVSMTGMGPVGEMLAAAGVKVHPIGMRPGRPDLRGLWQIVGRIRAYRPDVVQTWMYHADLAGGLAARMAGRPPVAWGLHYSKPDGLADKRVTMLTMRACARLSRTLPKRIVCCSHATRTAHAAHGYAEDRMVVIPNGFDTALFRPDPAARRSVREELCISESAPVIGLVARFHPDKDHANFLRGAGLLHRGRPDARFVLCGEGVQWANRALSDEIERQGLGPSVALLGLRTDVHRVCAAMDIASCSSTTEAFPNVVGEAMACGVPCVATDVGDCAWMIGDTGRVVPPGSADALAAAWDELLALGPGGLEDRGAAARARVESNFSLAAVSRRYHSLYEEMTRPCAA